MASSFNADAVSTCSEASTLVDGSVISNVPDRHGFFGGTQYSSEPRQGPPPETVLRREKKWLKMLGLWNFYMEKNYAKIRERCRKGIPMSIRPKAWLFLCGGRILMEKYPNKYEDCLKDRGDSKCIDDIKKDLHRQFPTHEMFSSEDKPGSFHLLNGSVYQPENGFIESGITKTIRNDPSLKLTCQFNFYPFHLLKCRYFWGHNGLSQQELFNVLKAYTIQNPKIGYCQAQAPVAAFLLMHMPAEQAFWCLVSISDKYLENYYSPTMEVIQRDALILQGLLKKVCRPAYKHLKKVGAEPMLYCTEWFLCAFTRTLPWDSLLRIWDVFLCEGVKILFKTALVIIIGCLGTAKSRKEAPGLCETLDLLRNPPEDVLFEENLIYNVSRLPLTERDFASEHQAQSLKMKAEKNGTTKR